MVLRDARTAVICGRKANDRDRREIPESQGLREIRATAVNATIEDVATGRDHGSASVVGEAVVVTVAREESVNVTEVREVSDIEVNLQVFFGRDIRNADYHFNGDDGRVRERRRSRSRGARRSRSPRLEKDSGKDRLSRESVPSRETASSYEKNAILKSTETHDPNRMEVDRTIPSHPAVSARQGATSVTPQPDLIKTTNTVETKYDEDIEVEIDPDVAAMQAMMGFGGFGSTQNKKVVGNDISAVRKEKKTEYRQYMNRVGGFNRPLSPTRE